MKLSTLLAAGTILLSGFSAAHADAVKFEMWHGLTGDLGDAVGEMFGHFVGLGGQHTADLVHAGIEGGGDLGWMGAGGFVPEFEEAMNGLAINGISGPVMSRFGVHLIQVLERRTVDIEPRQLREQARNALREQKYDEVYQDWVKELRAKAFVEVREWLD